MMLVAVPVLASDPGAEELARRTVERHAVEAAVWGMPMVGPEGDDQGEGW